MIKNNLSESAVDIADALVAFVIGSPVLFLGIVVLVMMAAILILVLKWRTCFVAPFFAAAAIGISMMPPFSLV